ncbi:MAG: hypothetical protein JST11_31845, partial [Acidobacteria bacterium]|nr:hypothetical protein [Acidobacteriota bacterium]
LDGLTGQAYPAYTPDDSAYLDSQPTSTLVHTDGTIFAVQVSNENWKDRSVVGIDPLSGARKFMALLEIPEDTDTVNYWNLWTYEAMIGGDGYYYLPYSYEATHNEGSGYQTWHLRLLRVDTAGAYDVMQVLDKTEADPLVAMVEIEAHIITNADTGALLTWSGMPFRLLTAEFGETAGAQRIAAAGAAQEGEDSGLELGMAITEGTSVTVVDGPRVPGQVGAVAPQVVTQDGLFVGTVQAGDWENMTTVMVAFDATGATYWSVEGEEPVMATDDGGVITRNGLMYDTAGGVTGSVVSMAVQSWRGNMYLSGQATRVALTNYPAGLTLWAQAAANYSSNHTASRPWYFKLVWQNTFSLYPDNPQYLPELIRDATTQAGVIKTAALAALKRAFDQYPVMVSEGRPNTGDNRANVIDGQNYNSDGESCGLSNPYPPSHESSVYYLAHMEGAQWALPIVLQTAQDAQAAVARVDLMKAIGAGIGNTAAYEVGHQFFGKNKRIGMDDSSVHTYNGQGCAGADAPWSYGVGAIQWGRPTAEAWKTALGVGWHR